MTKSAHPQRPSYAEAPFSGVAQLSLVEHALSPLSFETRSEGFLHHVSYPVYARGKRPVKANVGTKRGRSSFHHAMTAILSGSTVGQ